MPVLSPGNKVLWIKVVGIMNDITMSLLCLCSLYEFLCELSTLLNFFNEAILVFEKNSFEGRFSGNMLL